MVSGSFVSKVSGALCFFGVGVEVFAKADFPVFLSVAGRIGCSVFSIEDPAALSVTVARSDGGSGVSSQQVSRIKIWLSFVLSGSKCSWKIFLLPCRENSSGGYSYGSEAGTVCNNCLQSLTNEFASLLKHVITPVAVLSDNTTLKQ